MIKSLLIRLNTNNEDGKVNYNIMITLAIATFLLIFLQTTLAVSAVAPTAPTNVSVTPVGGTVVANTLNATNTNMTASATITAGQATGGYAKLLVAGVVKLTDNTIGAGDTSVTFDTSDGTPTNAELQTAIATGGVVKVKVYDAAGNSSTSSVSNPTLTVNYTTYTVTYNGNGSTGGSVPSTQTQIPKSTVTVSSNTGTLTKTSSVFNSWNTAADGRGTNYNADGTDTFTLTGDVTLYAVWKPVIKNVTIPNTAMKVGTATATITTSHDGGNAYNLQSGTIAGYTLGSLTRVNATTYTATFTVTEGGTDVAPGSTINVNNLVLSDEDVIFSDNFQTDSGVWTSDGYAGLGSGNYYVRASSTGVTSISTAGYTDLNLTFDAVANSTSMQATVQWYNGSVWNTAGYNDTTTWQSFVVNLPAQAENNPDFKLRMRYVGGAHMSNWSWYDNIVLRGIKSSSLAYSATITQNADSIDANSPTAPTTVTVTPVGGTVVANTLNSTNTNMTASATITAGQATGGYAELLVAGVVKSTDNKILAGDTSVTFSAGATTNAKLQTEIASAGVVTVKVYDAAGNSSTSLVGNPTLSVNYAAYAVTYNANGATSGTAPASQTKAYYNVGLTLQANKGRLIKTGYTFAGWNTAADGSGTSYAEGGAYTANAVATLYAKWTINNYTVTYNENTNTGGTVPTAVTQNYNTTVTVANNTGVLVKTGYTFGGWNTLADGSGTNYAAGTGTFTLTANITLFAKWNTNPYTVTYNGNGNTGGAVPTTVTQNYNTKVTVSNNTGVLVKTGYTFAGWNTLADGRGKNYAAGTGTFTVTGNITLYANWNINTYTVTYSGNGNTRGNAPAAVKENYNTTVTVPKNTGAHVKTGYTLGGWNTLADGSGTNYEAGTGTFTLTADITLFAKWNINTYTVTYSSNTSTGGTAPTAVKQNYNTTVTVANNTGVLVKTGYTFGGWNTSENGSGTNYAAGTGTFTPTDNITLYPKWIPNTYTVTYDGNTNTGGAVPTTVTQNYNTKVTVSNNTGVLVKTGYTFAGWNTLADGRGKNYAAGTGTFTVTGNITLYAKWKINTYTVTYSGNGNTGGKAPTAVKKNYNTAVAVSKNTGALVKTGYTFGGWNTLADGSGTNYVAGTGTFSLTDNITLYAKWNR